MRLPRLWALFRYWVQNPPSHELVAILVRCFTSWRPPADGGGRGGAAADAVARRRSIEARWRAGAMNPAQMLAALKGQPMKL
jgi:hypothetical protein